MNPNVLKQHRLFCELSDSTLRDLSELVLDVKFARGETICHQDEPGDSMYVVARGRVKVTTNSAATGAERILGFLDRDEHFGEMSVLTGSRRTASVISVTNTELLRIDRRAFDFLHQQAPGFCRAISNTLAKRLARSVDTRPTATVNRTIAVLYSSERCKEAAFEIHQEMKSLGANIHAVYPRHCQRSCSARGKPSHDCTTSRATSTAELHRLCEEHDRVLVFKAFKEAIADPKLMSQCDRILYFSDPDTGQDEDARISSLLEHNPELAPRIHRVCLLDTDERFATEPAVNGHSLGRDFKVSSCTRGSSMNRTQGLRRICRFLFDQRIGIALGGGGARGLAHLGVLQALEDEGIGIDLVAGTSMGALVGLSYVGGWSPQEATAIFRKQLTPGWFFRVLPHGRSWYMISKFRFSRWEGMLREIFGDATFEQLQIPLCTVSADLIQGGLVIRESGDTVNAVLESINLPHISRPILREQRMLVDGGVLNNVPVDLLRPRGANITIGVDVSSDLPSGFGRKKSWKSAVNHYRRPTFLETVRRLNEIRRFRVSRRGLAAADHMISVDTSRFEFADFSNASELTQAGYEAAQRSIGQIKQIVDDRLSQSLGAGH